MVLTEQKRNYLEKLSTKEGVISALAFDQRGALKRLMAQYQDTEPTVAQMEELKVLVAEELTPFASSMLLDPEYGLPATKVLDAEAALLLAYSCSTMMWIVLMNSTKKNKPTSNASVQNVRQKKFHSSLKSWLTMKQSLMQVL